MKSRKLTFFTLYINGGFVSDKPHPKDVDVAPEYFNVQEFYKVADQNKFLFFTDGLKAKYSVDLCKAYVHSTPDLQNARDYFQMMTDVELERRLLEPKDRKGILKVRLRS